MTIGPLSEALEKFPSFTRKKELTTVAPRQVSVLEDEVVVPWGPTIRSQGRCPPKRKARRSTDFVSLDLLLLGCKSPGDGGRLVTPGSDHSTADRTRGGTGGRCTL